MGNAFDHQLEEIFCAALEFAPEEREAYLERACVDDAELRAGVDRMLSKFPRAEQFFKNGPTAVDLSEIAELSGFQEQMGSLSNPEAEIGKQIGPYKLLQKIGEGGCGVVYMAEQEKPVRRRVALKIIKLGMDTKSVIARFNAERQALAMMEHPNIARVLDAGATEKGRPYFVMELVRGTKITELSDANNYDMRQRLGMFVQVCMAVQHAHQKGIIHRDLKPSNILVTMRDGVPVPKVIDFGIAKATGGERLTDMTVFTAYEQFIGTPAYMSPEQAEMSELDVDTRSDIYSLGVLLYELMTGRQPFDQKELLQAGLIEMRRTLREREPLRPSNRVGELDADELTQTAIVRRVEPPRLKLLLKGDLDWIVMKALEKDRNRRYQTANALAMDVQRYLDNEPVMARPPSSTYRLQKLIRRNKIAFASGCVVAVTLLLGLVISMLLLFRERDARREEERLRKKAEQAEQRENELREQAEAREKINQAAIFVSQEKFDEASQLLEEIKTPPPKPSFDGVSAYRYVGDWLALKGSWQEAADRYLALMEIDKLDKWSPVTLDFQACGTLLAECGRRSEYAQFCQMCVEGYGTTTNGDAAGRILKVCLLLPPDQGLLQQLKPMADANEKFVNGIDPKTLNSWAAISPALWRYRAGDYEKAVNYCNGTLNPNDKVSAQHATFRLILAMSCFQTGKTNEAQTQLSLARDTIETKFQRGLDRNHATGFWYDWIFAHVLLHEAIALVGNPN